MLEKKKILTIETYLPFSLMVVPTPAMVSLQVGFDLKENFDQKLFSVQSAAQADPVQEVTEGYNYEVTLMTPS